MPARPAGLRNWWRGGGAMEMEMVRWRCAAAAGRRGEHAPAFLFPVGRGRSKQLQLVDHVSVVQRLFRVACGVRQTETATLWLLEERHRLMIPLYLAFV